MLYTFKTHKLQQQSLPHHFKLYTYHFNLLHSLSFEPGQTNISTILSNLLQGRISHTHLLQIHAKVFRLHTHQDNLIATRLIGHYPPRVSLRIFDQLRNPNLFPFNAIIRVFANENRYHESFSLFKRLKWQLLSPNDLTFSFILKACFGSKNSFLVKQIHTHILKYGLVNDPFICNGLVAVYAKGVNHLACARTLFDEMPEKGLLCCWTSLISGFAQSGYSEEVLKIFCLMVKENLEPENDTMVSVFSACSNLEICQIEKWLTVLVELNIDGNLKSSTCDKVNNVLVYLYGKLGKIEKSRERFDDISDSGKRSVLPWNSMINAYVQNGYALEALCIFRLMVKDPNSRPNHVTMVSVLSACAQVGNLELGRWVHEYLKFKGRKGVLESNTFLATALIDMYSKCGSLDKAKEVFYQMVSKDVVSFNAMIMGLAINGEGQEAVKLFSKVQELGLHPNGGTFLGLLWACSHSGLSDEGRQIFLDMCSRFFVLPKLEHYACYIDLLSREGHLEEAVKVAASMPFKPNNFVWGALLGGCLLHSKVELAKNIYKRLVEVDPENSAGYVMLANVFAVDHQWSDVSALRWLMREKGVKKQPGCSWISINGIVHEFLVGSPLIPQIESIYHTLNALMKDLNIASA
ncbi:pentatricopeptide repeat-containing protein At2g29760, chloroplastic [Ricinus communis]|uniref:pentatricopeptide repeat-containing protein At2g29760, chloroplastic n=1 Tax=Ricinus communis TaxID=3988 RepID=UPI00201AB353|nr:pentatricopeptide repeat-containing protein At2g29760, chloroplastic [Ricinus communis]